jgi:hypothetical protein
VVTPGPTSSARANDQLEQFGLPPVDELEQELMSIEGLLRAQKVNLEDPRAQGLVEVLQTLLDKKDLTPETAAAYVGLFVQENPDVLLEQPTRYDEALSAAGFDPVFPVRSAQPGLASAIPGPAGGLRTETGSAFLPGPPPKLQERDGWIRYKNGVLVSPDGEVIFDPKAKAPGSPTWARTVSGWSPAQVLDWRQRLVDFGYLPKSKTNLNSEKVDLDFVTALQNYHINRYRNGGQPIAVSSGRGGGDGTPKPKPFDLNDISAQIRNGVRAEYERIYGVRPSEGETRQWADFIIGTGMSLQRQFIAKHDTPSTSAAVSEASERFIEKLEKSPKAIFLREADEENTQLRDMLTRMAQVSSGLTR